MTKPAEQSKPTIDEVKSAIRTILSDEKSYKTSLNYAVNYCRYVVLVDDPAEMKLQLLYVLNNISTGDTRKQKKSGNC